MPGHSFTTAYFGAFRESAYYPLISDGLPKPFITEPLPTLPDSPSTGDDTLLLSLQALAAQDYKHSLSYVNEAIDQGISWNAGKAEAFNLRGTFKYE